MRKDNPILISHSSFLQVDNSLYPAAVDFVAFDSAGVQLWLQPALLVAMSLDGLQQLPEIQELLPAWLALKHLRKLP